MDRYSGWVEICTPAGAPRALDRVRALVAAEQVHGAGVGLARGGGRWHVWMEGSGSAVVPFFKSVGSAAPGSCGVLDVEREQPAGWVLTRWVMLRGSVSAQASVQPHRTVATG